MKPCDVDIQIKVFQQTAYYYLLTMILPKEFSILREGWGEEFSPPFIGVPGLIIFYYFIICNLALYDNFSSLSSFKKFLRATYFTLLDTAYYIILTCPAHGSSLVTALVTALKVQISFQFLIRFQAGLHLAWDIFPILLVLYSFLLIHYLYIFTYCL